MIVHSDGGNDVRAISFDLTREEAVAQFGAVVAHTEYEQRFARLLGSDVRAFAFWKGRVALYAILRALGLQPDEEVVVVGFTCVVVPNAVRFAGGTPVYADIASGSYSLDADAAARAITPRTRALIVQHTFGLPAAIDELVALAQRHDLAVIEDCAHSLGSTYRGRPLGTFGDAAFFSSQWSKPFTTGLGGIAVTRDPDLARRLAEVQTSFTEPSESARWRLSVQYEVYRRFFSPRVYWLAQGLLRCIARTGLAVGSSSAAELAGSMPADHEWRMGASQQLTGVRKLEDIPAGIRRRRMLAARYDAGLAEASWPTAPRDDHAVLLRYPVLVRNKQALLHAARRAQVELGTWFETPLHPTPLNRHAPFGYTPGQCPNAEATAERIVNLPLHDRVTDDEADRVLEFFVAHATGA